MNDAHVNEVYELTRPGTIECRQVRLEPLAADFVRLRYLSCGICGSDLSKFDGMRPVNLPYSLGHEFIAVVEDVGDSVEAATVGELVTSDLNYRCGTCDHCTANRSHLCRSGQRGLFTNRAFATLGDLHESYILPLDTVPAIHLILSEPLSCALHALEWGDPGVADRTLVIGAGGMGLCMAFALVNRALPASFDITDLSLDRLTALGSLLAPLGRAIEVPLGDYDLVVDASGSASGLAKACAQVRDGGRLCMMSHLDLSSDGSFLLGALTRRDITFTVSYLNGPRETLADAARMLSTSWNADWNLVIERRPLTDLQSAFQTRRTSPYCKTVIDVSGG